MKVEVVGIWSDTINIRILIESSVVIPNETFSSLIPEAEEVVKKPIIAMRVMIEVGMIRLTR